MENLTPCFQTKKILFEKICSPTGNRTLVSRVTGGDTHHYTIEDRACLSGQKSHTLLEKKMTWIPPRYELVGKISGKPVPRAGVLEMFSLIMIGLAEARPEKNR